MNTSVIKRFSLLAVTIQLLLSGCSSNDEPNSKQSEPLTPNADMSKWLNSQRSTGNEVMNQLAKDSEEGNLLYSPMSLYSVMSMLAAGADGECATELADFLHFSDVAQAKDFNRQILENFPSLDTKTTLSLAGSVWIDNNLTVNETFRTTMSDYYAADVKSCDITSPTTLREINDWISEKTGGLITQHFSTSKQLKDICLVNTLYFKAPWTYPFKPSDTKVAQFTCTDGSKVSVDMMSNKTLSGIYHQENGAQVLSLSFGNGRFYATFILPPEGTDVRDYIADNSIMDLTACSNKMTTLVDVQLPKFEFSSHLDIKNTLMNMGMSEIFKYHAWPNLIDGDNIMAIQDVSQSVTVKIDEEGGTVSSATNASGQLTSNLAEHSFHANRPFIFTITEKACDVPLLMGTVEKF